MSFSKRTILVGFAFFSICAFWQIYDFAVPLILQNTFLMGDAAAGWVMALDNMFALFMLPIFGRLSDNCKSRFGRRMPYIVFGTIGAVILINLLPLVINAATALIERAYITEADLSLIETGLPRLKYIFIALLAMLLFVMCTYRSPAVALMPDLTPKPERSRANALINLMGAFGGVAVLALTSIISVSEEKLVAPSIAATESEAFTVVDFTAVFIIVAVLMAAAVLVLFLTIKERKLALPADDEPQPNESKRLPKPMLISLMFILFSVFFWFMGYNAVTTAFSKYYKHMWGDISGAALCMTIATAGAIVSYIPVGIISSRIGRKKMIIIGVAMLGTLFAAATFVRTFNPFVYVMFVLIGFAWAAINVNSYPMVVEISRSGSIGKYTGYYYTFSMAAQIVTPILSGLLLEYVGYESLFPYAAFMVMISLVTIMFVKHGDSRPKKTEALIENFNAED